jgi:hypothetical protein
MRWSFFVPASPARSPIFNYSHTARFRKRVLHHTPKIFAWQLPRQDENSKKKK